MKIRALLTLLLCVLLRSIAVAQSPNLSVQLLNGTHVDTVLNHYLAGDGVTLSNGKFNNHLGNIISNQIGVFHRNGFTQFPFESGLVICTGNATVAAGPNNAYDASLYVTSSYVEPSLHALSGTYVGDCAALEFDFMTIADTFVFRYVFASEEYCEYVNTQYNDIFAFFLTGPDPVTLLTTTRNVAIIPGSVSTAYPNGIPVTINNVNHGQHDAGTTGPGSYPSYSQFFVENNSINGIQFDGYTTALEAGSPVQACVNYHMKLSVCDVSDDLYDSGVFLEEHSFESTPNLTLSMSGFYCLHDSIVFNYTAQNVDSVLVVTPSGDTLYQPPFVIQDALASDTGYYYLMAKKTSGLGCGGTPWVSDSVYISIRIPCVSAICEGPVICAGDVASFAYAHDTIVGPWVSYVGSSLFTLNPPATLAQDTTIAYRFSMYDEYGCHFDTIVNVYYNALDNTVLDTSACDSFYWNDSLYQLSGTYSLTNLSANGCDSVATLHLTLHYSTTASDTLELVQNQLPYYFAPADTTFPVGSPPVFQFVFVIPTQHHCDSVITQTVIVHGNMEQTFDTVVCESDLPLEWHGHLFTEAGSLADTLTASTGNDSVIVLQLAVNPTFETIIHDEICEGSGYVSGLIVIPGDETVGIDSLDRTLELLSADGCDSLVYLHLNIVDTTLHIVSPTEDFCKEMSAELMVVTTFEDYVWSTGEQSPNITVTLPGVYSVTASQGGCRVTARYTVTGCDLHLYLPNTITPSRHEGLNDAFHIPEGLQPFLNDFEISIFNRWGEQVFYSTDKTFHWDGSVKGKVFVNTVYNYIIRYKNFDGKPEVVRGIITVL